MVLKSLEQSDHAYLYSMKGLQSDDEISANISKVRHMEVSVQDVRDTRMMVIKNLFAYTEKWKQGGIVIDQEKTNMFLSKNM